jgi:hypothetical protein
LGEKKKYALQPNEQRNPFFKRVKPSLNNTYYSPNPPSLLTRLRHGVASGLPAYKPFRKVAF